LGFGAGFGFSGVFFGLLWCFGGGFWFVGGDEVKGAAWDVDGGDADGDLLAYAVGAGVDETLAAAAARIVLGKSTADVVGADEAFGEEAFAADEDAEVGDGGDDGFGFFADAVGE